MGTEFYKMDLHIHTPASKCYTGSKNDEEYFEILRTAHKQNLDIIAITDHNTIAGYEHLFSLKAELQNKKEILSEFEDSTVKINDALAECDEKLSLFKDILIIPGIEITLNPGIHMLVLSTPDNLHMLSELLDSIGYTGDKRGTDSDTEINMDIKNFLLDTQLNNFTVIAPHIDSNKGIFNSLSGQFRGEIMRSPIISAFSCNAQSQKEKIINLFCNDPNYKRSYVPAFINCSDAHNVNDIGKKYSYIKLDDTSLSEIKKAFLTPETSISDISDQHLEKDICKLIEDENPILISDPELVNTLDLSHYICACLNDDINYIVIGINSDKKIIGIKNNDCNFKKVVNDALDLISSQCMQLRYSITIEVLGNGNNIIIICLNPSTNCLWYIKEEKLVYILDNTIPTPATITQIESLVHENTLREIGKLEQKNTQTVTNIGAQLLSISNTIEKHELIQDIMITGIPLLSIYNFAAHTSTKLTKEFNDMYFEGNGLPNGNFYFITKNQIRLPDAILRYSCPTTNLPEDILKDIDLVQLPTISIVISQYGGTHITTCNHSIIGKETDYLILTPKKDEQLSPYVILAWLKSSLFTWFVYKRYNTTNIYLPEILREIVVPYDILEGISEDLHTIIQEILENESEFLTKLNNKEDLCKKCQRCTDDGCLLEKLLNEHNQIVNQKTSRLDQSIFDAFHIDESQQTFIKNDLNAANIFNII